MIPVEVKSGANVKSKSLKFYYNKYLHSYTIRFSILDFEDEGWVKNIPLWSVCGAIE